MELDELWLATYDILSELEYLELGLSSFTFSSKNIRFFYYIVVSLFWAKIPYIRSIKFAISANLNCSVLRIISKYQKMIKFPKISSTPHHKMNIHHIFRSIHFISIKIAILNKILNNQK